MVGYLIMNNSHRIIEMSSQCVALLKLDAKLVLKKKAKVHVQTIFPSVGHGSFIGQEKAGKQYDCFYPVSEVVE
jgi:hypothetical protein